jgi:hypothetical protein
MDNVFNPNTKRTGAARPLGSTNHLSTCVTSQIQTKQGNKKDTMPKRRKPKELPAARILRHLYAPQDIQAQAESTDH